MMNDFERMDTPIDGIDTRIIQKNGIAYLATSHLAPDKQQFVDNEIARIQAGMETADQRLAVEGMLRPVLERDAGLSE
jgi:hypothetical protein